MCSFKRKFPTDTEVRERLKNAGEFWRERFDPVDIYFFVAPYPGDEKERPALISSFGEPDNPRIITEVKDFGGDIFENPLDVNKKLYKVWIGTREKYKNEMKFRDDRDRFGKEVVMTADELKKEKFIGDCDDFAREDFSKAQRVLKLYAKYLGVPEDDVIWAARYVIGSTFSGIGHASLNLADLEQVIKKKNKPKCKWKNSNSTTFYYEAVRSGWAGFSRFPNVGNRRFVLNHRNIWGSADNKQCYMRVEELPNVGDEFYERYNLISYFTQPEKEKFGECVNGMKNLLTSYHWNVEAMKTALNLAEGYTEINDSAIDSICEELGERKIGKYTMLQRIGSKYGVKKTLRLKYQF